MPASTVSYTKFSDKLTDSLNDINRMINENKEMIDSIQEVALGLTCLRSQSRLSGQDRAG